LKREWFQKPPNVSWPHYNLAASKRAEALAAGAVIGDRYKTVEVALILRGQLTDERRQWLAKLRTKAEVREAR
jgi:hypothetical protein